MSGKYICIIGRPSFENATVSVIFIVENIFTIAKLNRVTEAIDKFNLLKRRKTVYKYHTEPSRVGAYTYVFTQLHLLPVAQTPRNKRVFVAVCSSYQNGVHICISASIINISPLRNQMI